MESSDSYYYGAETMLEPATLHDEANVAYHPGLLHDTHRLLQTGPTGRTVLTVLYLCVLGLCFVVPLFYYIRMQCDGRRAQRLQDMELAGIADAIALSENMHREESRAARRKFREERTARIQQLFSPVKLQLTEFNFPHLRTTQSRSDAQIRLSTMPQNINLRELAAGKLEPPSAAEEADVEAAINSSTRSAPQERGIAAEQEPGTDTTTPLPPHEDDESASNSVDEDQLFIEIPAPGFQFASASILIGQFRHRLAPNVCSICLGNYYPGDSVVWSSNEACEHVFHEQCILQWLMKQREGPLCPCCRRDFVVDPYDMEDDGPNLLFMATEEEVRDVLAAEQARTVNGIDFQGEADRDNETRIDGADLTMQQMEEGTSSSSRSSPTEMEREGGDRIQEISGVD